jgi:hypothetical protein
MPSEPFRSEARTIDRLPIESSGIKSLGYADDRKVLSIEFPSGETWHYDGVALETFEAMCAAPSRGGFYARHIKGKFQGRCMTGLCPKCAAFGYVGETCEDCGTAAIRAVERRRKP